jgi:hypothetical protein
MKNNRVNVYDHAFPEEIPVNDDFITQIRETFFSILKPFLVNIDRYIDKTVDPTTASFYVYFKKDDYLESFEISE